jgi:hypothetical protein
MKKLVSENLNEFVHPGVGGYSADQLERDLRDLIASDYAHLNMEEEEIKDFLDQAAGPAFAGGYIKSQDDLIRFVEDQY